MKLKKPSLSTIIFGIFLVLLIIPQTRSPIQVAVNKLKVLVWSPTKIDQEDQDQLTPFSYQLTGLNGEPARIEIGQGEISFISYWATWCPPSIAELPSIAKLYLDYGQQMNFVLLTNEDPKIVRQFLEKKGLDLPVYFPRMATPKALYDSSIPTNYIVDKTGNIIIKETGAADWNSEKVRRILDVLHKE